MVIFEQWNRLQLMDYSGNSGAGADPGEKIQFYLHFYFLYIKMIRSVYILVSVECFGLWDKSILIDVC